MKVRIALSLVASLSAFYALAAAPAAQTTLPSTRPNMTPGQIMSAAFSGNASLVNKAASPTATDAEKKAFLDFSKALAATKAPKGDGADWSKRTHAILAAAQDVVDGKPNAANALKTATSCKACHDLYR